MSPPPEAAFVDAAPIFAALGDPTRLRLVSRLSVEGPLSISTLSEGAGVSRQAITKHLLALSSAGLVHGERRGREHRWALETDRIDEAVRYLESISRSWDDVLGRLQTFVEKEQGK